MYGQMFPYHNTPSLSYTQTGLTMIQFVSYLNYEIYIKHITKLYFHVSKHIQIRCCTKPNHSARIIQLLNIFWLVICFGHENITTYIITTMDQEKQRFMFLTLFYSIPLILIYCMYILLVLPCIPSSNHVHCILYVPILKQRNQENVCNT